MHNETDNTVACSRERRAFYFFRNNLADDYKRMILIRILYFVRNNGGARMDLLRKEFKTLCSDAAIIDDAVQALANKEALHGLTVLRFGKNKTKNDDFTIKHRNSDTIASWEKYLQETHPELVAMVSARKH